MTIDTLRYQLKNNPNTIEFAEVMALISELYNYTPAKFTNGLDEDCIVNEPGINEGSCKLFSFALDQKLTEEQTLQCFGRYYREDVLENAEGSDHVNIRAFIKHGWKGIDFEQKALTKK